MDTYKCKICNNNLEKIIMTFDTPDAMEVAANVKKENYQRNYYCCDYCGVYQSDLAYNSIDNDIYSKNYYEHVDHETIEGKFNRVMSMTENQSDNWKRINRVLKTVNKYRENLKLCQGSSLLDVGAGTGVFIGKLKTIDQSWTTSALEPDAHACNHLRKVLNTEVVEDVLRPRVIKQRYDLITLNRVLEHIPEVSQVMNLVTSFLKPGGIVYVELPDIITLHHNGKEDDAFASAHLTIFDIKTLVILFEKSCLFPLEISRVKDPSGKYTVYGFASYLDKRVNN